MHEIFKTLKWFLKLMARLVKFNPITILSPSFFSVSAYKSELRWPKKGK